MTTGVGFRSSSSWQTAARGRRARGRAWARRLAEAGALAGLALGAPTGCSDADCTFVDDEVAGRSVNPEGLPYPTEDLGARPREGTVPGQHFPNFSFRGYSAGEASDELEVVSLADFYDPESRRLRLLWVMGAAMWCPYCRAETDDMVAVAPTLRAEGVEFLQVLIDGPSQGEAPDRCDLDEWVDEHDVVLAVVLDHEGRRLRSVATIPGVPYNLVIDPRTMEVLDAGTGQPADLAAAARSGLAWIDANPR